ncbi:LysR family transcriptional regulator [Bailinhaonella thermotolerans]|uniref:LysR family transcriptional regulator n=1 Tax=Bailinhaonella thermotolerans TaxID=1070861 RepID=A0A3A4B8N4_9ACTN|nr:LysR family transcriptional regulator [Bailinhaonella thermotolerans]RJL30488.1 LysR family transcriptional regulator [Bailinhaonella thermotolerans]
MLDLHRLQVLRELRERGTVSAVADALGYTASAVSQQLARLQREVGVPLHERVGRRIRLTPAGEVLAAHADTLLAQAELAAEETVAASGRVHGHVRIMGYQTSILHVIIPSLGPLAERYPELDIEVVDDESDSGIHALALGEVDLLVFNEYEMLPMVRPPGLEAETLLYEPVWLAIPAAHPLAATTGPVSLSALAEESWVCGSPGTRHRELVIRACTELGGFDPRIRYETNDLYVLIDLVINGRAVAFMADLVAARALPGMALLKVTDFDQRRRMCVWTRQGAAQRPTVAAVLAAFREATAEVVRARPLCERPPAGGAGGDQMRR